jgi:hypothetical protein
MIKIANKRLLRFGFKIGDTVEVEYQKSKIILTKIRNQKLKQNKNLNDIQDVCV